MLEKIYCIYTNNRFNQVLLFESYQAAYNWCKAATRWTETEIQANIKKPLKLGSEEYVSIFDPHKFIDAMQV